MRRKYAFESEGVSDAVQTQLEAVEDAVDEKCTTPEECDKVIDKIDGQTEKFNDALAAAKEKAQDCKDGKCDKAEMAKLIDDKMCCLKDMAKKIGVASEGDVPTEEDIKNVKDYLEGAKEIVETKKEELDGGESSESDDDDDDDDTITADGENAEESFFMSEASEAFKVLSSANATANMKDMDVITAYIKANKASIKSDITTEEKMKTAVNGYNKQYSKETGMSLALKTIAGVPVIISKQGGNIIDIQYDVGKPRFKAISMPRLRTKVGKSIKADLKAKAKADKKSGSMDSELFSSFTNRCLNLMTPASESNTSDSWDDIFVD